jgi:acyl carrier protein
LSKKNKDLLIQIFSVVFDLSEEDEINNFRKLTEDRWDSLRQVSLIVAIESEFAIKIDTSEAELITSFRAAIAFLEVKGI